MKKLFAIVFGVLGVLGVGVASAEPAQFLLEGDVGYGVASGKSLLTDITGPVYTLRIGVKNDAGDGYIVYRRMQDLYNDGFWREDVTLDSMGIGARLKDDKQFVSFEGGVAILDVDVELIDTRVYADQWIGTFLGISAGIFIGEHAHLEMSLQGHAMQDDLVSTTAIFSIGANL